VACARGEAWQSHDIGGSSPSTTATGDPLSSSTSAVVAHFLFHGGATRRGPHLLHLHVTPRCGNYGDRVPSMRHGGAVHERSRRWWYGRSGRRRRSPNGLGEHTVASRGAGLTYERVSFLSFFCFLQGPCTPRNNSEADGLLMPG
jgi:hypothetical protein